MRLHCQITRSKEATVKTDPNGEGNVTGNA